MEKTQSDREVVVRKMAECAVIYETKAFGGYR